MIWLALLACGGAETVVLTGAQNYTFQSTIHAECQTIPAQQDARVDWAGLTSDILGNPVDPTTDVDGLGLALFGDLGPEEVLAGINEDTLAQSDVAGFAEVQPPDGDTEALLSSFSTMGTPLDLSLLVEGSGTFLLNSTTTLPDGRVQYQTFTFLCPVADAPEADVALGPDSATLDWSVDLEQLEPIALTGARRVLVDWSELTENGSGQAIDLSDIDRMLLARYDQPIADLEADFLRVESLAAETWSADVEGWGDWLLSDLETADGEAFAGFTGEGTWLLALQCTTCINPAPPFLGVIAP